ncbi:MAG: Lrp/AsnC family transcriptional regulator [Acidimicrobiales bacterium]|jgi:Lrp/AsnC family leucine-responsive transcriptional regulator
MKEVTMDEIDRALLVALSDDGRLSYQQLAALVHLSANSTADRVRRLRQSGVLAGFHAELDLAALGHTLHSLTDVNLKESVDRHEFERALNGVPQVLSAVHTTGELDYQLRIVSRNTDELQSVLDTLQKLGTRDVQSRIVLGETTYEASRLL